MAVSRAIGIGFAIVLLSVMFSPLIPSARAPQSVKWFENQGIDQPNTVINQPSAQYFQGWTYVAWQGTVDFLPYMKRYNHTTGTWSASSQISGSNPIAGDGHGAPAFLITPSGRIHVFFGAHLSPLKYVRGDVATFGVWVTRPDPDTVVTYPHVVYAGDPKKLWLFYRSGDACGAWGDRVSSDDGDTWSGEGTFIDSGIGGVYVGGITADNTGAGIYMQYTALKNDCSTDTTNRTGSYITYYLPDNGAKFWCKGYPSDIDIGFFITSIDPQCAIERGVFTNNIKDNTCYADSAFIGQPVINACDDNVGTLWLSTNTPYPHWVVINLTSTYHITSVSLNAGTAPAATGHIDIWNGTAWIAYANFTQLPTTNISVPLDQPFDGDRIRVYGTSGVGGSNFMGYNEVWVFGTPIATVSNFGMVRKQTGTLTSDEVFAAYITGDIAPVGTWKFRFAYWTGSTWARQTIAYGDHFQDYIDFREINATTIDAFLESNATDGSGSKEGGNMVHWHWNGTWANAGTLITAAESGALLSAPVVPVDAIDSAQIWFDQRVITLTEAHQKLYMWGSGGFLGTIQPSTGFFAFANNFFLSAAFAIMIIGALLMVGIQRRVRFRK